MARLDALPVELLCDIFQYVHDSCESSNDLFSVSLLCRKYYPVARDVLYKAPRLLQPKPTDDRKWYYRRRHQLRSLLRTTISQPHLAKQIGELEVTVALRSSHWTPRTPADLGTIDVENETVQSLPCTSADWTARICSGDEAATCALILGLIPSLRRLSLNAVKMCHSFAQDEDYFVNQAPRIYDWFDFSPGSFDTSEIAGLKNLLSIKSDEWYPRCLLNIPTIEAIELSEPQFSFGLHQRPLSNVSSVTLHSDHYSTESLNHWQQWAHVMAESMFLNLQYLPRLETLHLIVTGSVDQDSADDRFGDYPYPLMAPNLRTFIYDTRAVFHHGEVHIPRPSPIETCFVHLLQGFAEANNTPQLEKVEMWPGLYQGDSESAFAFPDTLHTWSDQFTMYTGDKDSLKRVENGEVSSDAVWPHRIVYLKD
ncbi:hypothetical protein HBI47_117380 [Parastagonospora nodorum]|nr:hypothetical protein HBI47_117380 [Parastagonospora nodorum]